MTPLRLLFRNLFYHWRGNLAVFLGVAVGAAVLTGALLVGDSLRGSLRDLTLRRLGWVDDAVIAGRFFRERSVIGLPAHQVSPAILVRGTVSSARDGRSVRQVNLCGVSPSFWPGGRSPDPATAFWDMPQDKVILGRALADQLDARPGDKVHFRVGKAGAIPPELLLGKRDEGAVTAVIEATVLIILNADDFGSRFNLAPSTEPPRNAFLPITTLQKALAEEDRINAVFTGGEQPGLQDAFRRRLELPDWGLTVRDQTGQEPFLTLESRQLMIEPAVESAALMAAKDVKLRAAPTLVYIADKLSDGQANVPYVVVAALDPAAGPPLGPFLPEGIKEVKDDEIVLAEWPGSPIRAKRGDMITLSYYPPEEHGEFKLREARFRLAGTIPMAGPANDRGLAPEVKGITDVADFRQWKNPPFPYDPTRIHPEDERYWNEHRATPRAYVTLAAGQKLWGSRFGNVTSVRLATEDESDPAKSKDTFEAALKARLNPDQAGLAFTPIKEQALKASEGSTDFAGLFLGFSCFLIAAALLLVGLLFRLNLDRRASEYGLLTAVGWPRWKICLLLLAEGVLLAVAGTMVGCLASVAYCALLVQFLGAFWPGGALASFLRPHYTVLSFVIGGAGSLIVSVLTILWTVIVLGFVAPTALLAGRTTAEGAAVGERRPRWSLWTAVISFVVAIGLAVAGWFVPGGENQAMTFFGAGSLLLVAFLAGAAAWMRGARHGLVEGGGWGGVARLGVRNAARHPVRSLLTAGLLASAVFLIVAVEAFRQQAAPGGKDIHGPDGGFALVAESDLPVVQDFKSDKGMDELIRKLQIQLQKKYGGKELDQRLDAAEATLRSATYYPFRVRDGDDVSCLNLYEPRKPRMLGAPPALIDRGGFPFADSNAKTRAERDNPWLILRRPASALPAFGDQNSVVWVLHKNLGDTLTTPADDGGARPVRIEGLFQDSLFQSGLVLSESDFLKLYPTEEGYRFFLIEAPPDKAGEVRELLNTALADRGFEAKPTAEVLQSYLAVENTYLSTFQALGGLGLVLGSLGLAVVLLRSVWERRGELALLRALGFRRRTLGWLVLAENGFLLLLGLAAGAVSALLAAAPHLARQAAGTPWLGLAAVLAGTLAVGLAVGAVAAAGALRAPLVAALRRE